MTYARGTPEAELQSKGYISSDRTQTETQYNNQYNEIGKAQAELIRKYRTMGIPVTETKITKLVNERTGQVIYQTRKEKK